MSEAILITQCLQHDFVRPIERHEPLPNRLHVGHAEARRLLGERVEEGPIHVLLEWAYGMPEERLALVHIRDWHAPADREQHGHLEQFGAHCLAGTPGAEFVFRPVVRAGRSHRVVDASGLNDFVRTDLERLLEPYRGRPLRVGIVGVWTEAKVTFLAYELATRYPEFELATCSALTASSSRAMHFVALDQLRSVLGVRVFASVGAFTEYLAGSQPELGARVRHARVDPGRLRFHPPDYPAAPADRELLAYLFREAREVDLDCLDGGFSGNLVLRARSRDALGHQQVP
jgi:nicotinamidase-related amidase